MVNGFSTWANIGDMSAYGDADDEDIPVGGAAAQLALHQQQPAAAPGPDLRDDAGQGGEEEARPRGGGHGGEAGRGYEAILVTCELCAGSLATAARSSGAAVP